MEKRTGESYAVGIELTFLANMVSHMVEYEGLQGKSKKAQYFRENMPGLRPVFFFKELKRKTEK